jgi:hypothetical protein
MGEWVIGQMGHQNLMGDMGHVFLFIVTVISNLRKVLSLVNRPTDHHHSID